MRKAKGVETAGELSQSRRMEGLTPGLSEGDGTTEGKEAAAGGGIWKESCAAQSGA